MIRKPNLFKKPRKKYESSRIKEENVLLERYGLKNKKEIWKTIAKLRYYRKRAMALAKSSVEEQEVLFRKLRNLGLKTLSIADVLDLNVEDFLRRRLQTVIADKKMARTSKHARQLIVHRKVLINGKIVNVPGYLVSVEEESSINVKLPVKKEKAEINESKQEIKEEKLEQEIKQ